jgi:DNA-binding LacI/PurR family transcriptional regulator
MPAFPACSLRETPCLGRATVQKVPRKTSLVAETEQCLRLGMAQSRWRVNLPGIRRLAQELQVSSWTVEAALQGLARAGLIRIAQGKPCQIVAGLRKKRLRPGPWSIGCILHRPLWENRPWSLIWLNELRMGVQKVGGEFELYYLPRVYGPGTSALVKLVEENPHDCWILSRSTREMQAWFEQRNIPVFVAGTVFPDIRLPSIDLDYRALGQHAAGMMLAYGHRQCAFVTSRLERTGHPSSGMMELERGMREALGPPKAAADAKFIPIYHNFRDKPDVCRAFARLLELSPRPTVVLISHPDTFLTGFSFLAQRGIVIPRDLSIIVAENEPYFSHWVPELTYYEVSPVSIARQMRGLIQRALEHTLSPGSKIRLTPRFIAGGTLRRLGRVRA